MEAGNGKGYGSGSLAGMWGSRMRGSKGWGIMGRGFWAGMCFRERERELSLGFGIWDLGFG